MDMEVLARAEDDSKIEPPRKLKDEDWVQWQLRRRILPVALVVLIMLLDGLWLAILLLALTIQKFESRCRQHSVRYRWQQQLRPSTSILLESALGQPCFVFNREKQYISARRYLE
jgi:hypothetical protein